MKILRFAAVLLLFLSPAFAQSPTLITMRFTFDDGTPVAGKVTINNAPGQNGGSLTVTLDPTGYLQQSLALSPSATYTGQIEVDNSNAGGPVPWKLNQLPTGTPTSPAAIAALGTGEIDIVVSKADGTFANAQFNVFAPFPQVKLSTCVSVPPFGATPNNPGNKDLTADAGGGPIIDYVAAGEKFDCQGPLKAGTYTLGVRAETPGTVPMHFEYPAGTKVGTAVSVSPTISTWGAGEGWQTFSGGTVSLPGGAIIRLVVDAASKWAVNLNWIN